MAYGSLLARCAPPSRAARKSAKLNAAGAVAATELGKGRRVKARWLLPLLRGMATLLYYYGASVRHAVLWAAWRQGKAEVPLLPLHTFQTHLALPCCGQATVLHAAAPPADGWLNFSSRAGHASSTLPVCHPGPGVARRLVAALSTFLYIGVP